MQSMHSPEYSATKMGKFPICKLKWDLLRTSVRAGTIDKNTFSAPFWNLLCENRYLKEIFLKKSSSKPYWGAPYFQTPISKCELP